MPSSPAPVRVDRHLRTKQSSKLIFRKLPCYIRRLAHDAIRNLPYPVPDLVPQPVREVIDDCTALTHADVTHFISTQVFSYILRPLTPRLLAHSLLQMLRRQALKGSAITLPPLHTYAHLLLFSFPFPLAAVFLSLSTKLISTRDQ
jgi:hypothetical protein